MGYLVTFLKGLLSEAHNLKCFSYFFPSKPSIFTIKHLEYTINVNKQEKQMYSSINEKQPQLNFIV